MNRTLTALALLSTSVLLGSCEEKKSTIVLGRKGVECDLSWDNIAGTVWVLLKINPDKTETPDKQARLKLYEEGGSLKAKYSVASLSDVYTYNCKERGEELMCKEEPKVKDWCQALYVAGKECTPENLRAIDGDITDSQIEEGVKEAMEVIEKYEGTDKWDRFVFNNNNLGNKLQGIAYLRIDDRNCRLIITDHYMTIYNGKRIEDSNPVGTNPMVRNTDPKTGEKKFEELLWEHCTDSSDLIATKSAEFPDSEEDAMEQWCIPNRGCSYAPGETVYYHYIGQDGRKPEDAEDCTWSFSAWANWEPLKKDIPVKKVKFKGTEEYRYPFSTSYDEPGAKVFEIVRYKTCDGKKEKVEVTCNAIKVQ